jgi:hypothetical protein
MSWLVRSPRLRSSARRPKEAETDDSEEHLNATRKNMANPLHELKETSPTIPTSWNELPPIDTSKAKVELIRGSAQAHAMAMATMCIAHTVVATVTPAPITRNKHILWTLAMSNNHGWSPSVERVLQPRWPPQRKLECAPVRPPAISSRTTEGHRWTAYAINCPYRISGRGGAHGEPY